MPSSPTVNLRFAAGIACASFASLLLELALTRLFSVTLFYHFAFLAISIALLGLGAGGVFAYVRRAALERYPTRTLATRLCIVNAFAIVAALWIVLHIPVSLQLDWTNFGRVTIIYLVSAVPFFFTGLLFSIVFAREKAHVSQLYGSDLLGGSLACLLVVPVLNWFGGPNAVIAAALAMAFAAWIWADSRPRATYAAVACALLLALISFNYRGDLFDIVYAKGMRRDQPWVEFARWNAISRVEVDDQGGAKVIVIDADASTYIMGVDPMNLKGTWAERDLMSAAPSVANVLRPHGKYAIIGPGGGVDVLRAVANGSKDVTGIEINPIIVNNIMRRRYRAYSKDLYERPEVRIFISDGRSFVRRSPEKYDVIQMTLVDTWASTAAGAFALSENNLYTVEAFREYFEHLNDDGLIAITRWEFKEPREALRVVSQEIEALRLLGVVDTKNLFIVVSEGALTEDGRPVTVLAKKTPFNHREQQEILRHLRENEKLHLVYLPVIDSQSGRPEGWDLPQQAAASAREPFRRLIAAHVVEKAVSSPSPPGSAVQWDPRWTFVSEYPYDISPVYDSSPFFFFTLRTGHVLKNVFAGTGRGMDWRINLGIVILGVVLIVSIVAVLAFLILPLALHEHARLQNKSRLLYFVAIGLGYILVEIALIQRFVLFLGHPTYALTVVIFLMLLSSGAGSVMSRRWLSDPRSVWRVLILVVAGIVLYLAALPWILGSLVGLEMPVKLLVSATLLIPLGFAMGMPFPSGLRALSELNEREATIEWAFAMNASASVLGSVTAMVVAIHLGLTITLATGAVAYAMALLLVRSFKPAPA